MTRWMRGASSPLALRAARAGMFDTLLVYRVDRFSRRLRDLVALLDELADAGVVFRSATEPFDTSTPVGRMLVQMLGVFAEFEREVIIDRVISGMERKAAKGLWTGGTTPYGYAVDPKTHNYTIIEAEAATVWLIFDLYANDRLGTRAVAHTLNDRGLRTRRGKPWSQRSVEVIVTNRQYIGEKHFRDISVADAHDPIVDRATFDHAQGIMTKRSQDIGQRAANGSEYTLTGKIRCPQCGSTYIGSVAHGRNQRYRYYTCWSRHRYGPAKGCDIHRFHADELETAIGQALLEFYTHHHDIITEAADQFLTEFHSDTSDQRQQLTAINHELKDNAAALDRYLTAFERGTLDDEDPDVQARLTSLKHQSKQLRGRKAQLEFDLETPPTAPTPDELTEISDHIKEIITNGGHKAKKTLFEALIERIEVKSERAILPHFRIPIAANDHRDDTVRLQPHLVGRAGIEPATGGL